MGHVEAVGGPGGTAVLGPARQVSQGGTHRQERQGHHVGQGQGAQARGYGPPVLDAYGRHTGERGEDHQPHPTQGEPRTGRRNPYQDGGRPQAVDTQPDVDQGGAAQGGAVQEGVGEVRGPHGDGAADTAQEEGVQGQPGPPRGQGPAQDQHGQDGGTHQPAHHDGVAAHLGGAAVGTTWW